MSRHLLLALFSLAAAHAVGCDSGERGAIDSGIEGGKGIRPESTFPQEDPTARQIQGRVLFGTEPVPNANVQLEPSPGFARDETLRDAGDPGFLTSTDNSGRYRILNGPFFYDLSVRKDREVAVYRQLARRNFDPSFGREDPVRGFTSRIAATTNPPPAPGNEVAFLIEGADARAISGDAGSLVATFRRFDTTITLRAIEYAASGGIATAMRAGRVDVLVHDGGAASVVVPTAHEAAVNATDIRFIALPPAGFALSMVDVVMDFGVRTGARPVASVAAGTPLRFVIVADARYFARVRALGDGASSDSGLQQFNPDDKSRALTLPPPVADTAFDGSGFSAAAKAGVVEHVLVPASGAGISVRIATEARLTTLPDLTRLGLARPTGSYAWTVQHFPVLERIDDLGGEDGRLFTPASITKPRTIVLP